MNKRAIRYITSLTLESSFHDVKRMAVIVKYSAMDQLVIAGVLMNWELNWNKLSKEEDQIVLKVKYFNISSKDILVIENLRGTFQKKLR